MKRLVIYADEIRVLMRWGKTKAYEEIATIRAVYPSSGKLRARGAVLVQDFAKYNNLDIEDVHNSLTDKFRP